MSSRLSLRSLQQINVICNAFEDQWLRQETPQIETVLQSAEETERSALLYELLLLEFHYREDRRESPSVDEYRSRFPHDAETITLAFKDYFLSSPTRSAADTEPADQDDFPLQEGESIGRYRVVRLLGSGTFASVYLARDPDNDRLRAVKLQRRRTSSDEIGGLLEEAHVLESVADQGIVPIVDAGQHSDGRPYLVMEYVQGETLKSLLHDGTLTRKRAVSLIADLASTMSLVHRKGLFHRDLKPANILVDQYDRPRVVDFGLAVHESTQRERAGEFAGSIAYMSPEQVRGEANRLDGRADIWALGVILYEVLAGRRPFRGGTRDEVVEDILLRQPRPPRQIVGNVFSRELESICLKALSKEITDRFATAQDMADALRRALDPSPAPLTASVVPTPSRMTRTIAWSLGLVLLAFALIGGAALFRAQEKRFKNKSAGALVRLLSTADFSEVPQLVDEIGQSGEWTVPHLKQELAQSDDEDQKLRYRLAMLKTQPDPSQVVPVLDSLLNQDAKLIASWRDILFRHPSNKFRDEAVGFLRAELSNSQGPVAERFRLWSPPANTHVESFEQAGGVLGDESAFLPVMPMEDFVPTAEALRASNYRPLKVRPFLKDGVVCVAAVWTRDNLDWQCAYSLSEKELREFDTQQRQRGFRPIDVAAYIDEKDRRRLAHCGIWARSNNSAGQVFWLLGVDSKKHASEAASLITAGFQQQSVSVVNSPAGEPLVSSIWRLAEGSSFSIADEIQPDYFGDVSHLCDIAVRTSDFPGRTTTGRFVRQRALAKQLLAKTPNAGPARFLAGRADYYLGDFQLALHHLDWVAENAPQLRYYALPLSAIARARCGQRERAEADLQAYRQVLSDRRTSLGWSGAYVACLESKIAAYTGSIAEGLGNLEARVEQRRGDKETLFYAACAYSAIASFVEERASEESKKYAARAVEMLQDAKVRESRLCVAVDLDRIRTVPGFRDLVPRSYPSYSVVWQARDDLAAKFCYRLTPEKHQERCRQFSRLGYHPVAISSLQPAPGEPLLVASVWHRRARRPRAEHFVSRQANAAAALLRLDSNAATWQLLRQSDQPQLRPQLIERLHVLGVDQRAISRRLTDETLDASVRRALLLGLGDYELDVASATTQRLVAKVRKLHQEDADAGVQAAAGWLLRAWGEAASVTDGRVTSSPQPIPESATWAVNVEGHTMVLLPAPGKISIGSPNTEPDRDGDEQLRVVELDRSFAISATEVTIGQWTRLHGGQTRLDGEPSDLPAQVTWYEAAEYCNLLSEHEGIPPAQWCYFPNEDGSFAKGMRVAADYHQRQGYRLPTEVEWEYACRAGAKTAWSHGDSGELLDGYAWFYDNSDQSPHPVSMLKPNDFGLFDMSGNVMEWCQDSVIGSSTREVPRGENEELRVTDETQFVVRGGSFNLGAPETRAAARVAFAARKRQQLGFRVVRTLGVATELAENPRRSTVSLP